MVNLWHSWVGRLGATPLRYTLTLLIVLGVSTPAMLLLAIETELAKESQRTMLAQSEQALMGIGSLSLVEPMWVVDRGALETVVDRLLENPQVVAVRIEDQVSSAQPLFQVRAQFTQSVDDATATGDLHRHVWPVKRSGEVLGTMVVWFDARYGQGLLEQRRNQMMILVVLQVLLSVGVLLPMLAYRIMRPIERLKAQASTLVTHMHGGAGPVFVWQRDDELGLLGRHLGSVQTQLRTLFSQLADKNAQLEQMALYDQLTGVPNRSLFTDLVQREIVAARRNDQRFGIFFIDLDRFKSVNDSMGHAAGDALLVEVASRLRDALREIDVVCRQSGDEFLVLARDITHWEVLGEMADRVLSAVEQPFLLPAGEARVSASIGIALFPEDAQNFENLIKHADIAMYQAKALGRARYSFFHAELNVRLHDAIALEKELAHAIVAGQLVMHYQPQVDTLTGVLSGVEALVRWQHPERGLLYPGHFIGIAEESGLIADMGAWTLNAACQQKAAWKAAGIEVGCMSVNVSALEFRDHRLIQNLQTALLDHDLLPGELEIEVTESVLMVETDTSQRMIERIRALGVGLSIDDFGTGYSSLSYLKRLRPNQLKIDRSFVSDSGNDADSRAIVQGVVGLAKALGLTVVAEGIETQEQLIFLRDSGCHVVQGYLLGRPLAADALEAWLAASHTRAVYFA
jgi:diguanylate cyclase (GGDEF)-like protein